MLIKVVHLFCVVTTISLFFIRGLWMINESEYQHRKWTKWFPPIIDTLLLVSAISLMLSIEQYPFVYSWLTAKVVALFLYIGLGLLALTYGRTKKIRVLSWIGALVVFFYIVLVALTKNPVFMF